ncbi:TraB/GumN family protein [Sphingobium sufflavum]|uniref:TraB/GumN family protein n=1 Tax=Sphingobium sufflavum TaxID=1129547 RepID=UPI001F46BBE6|nr:TraB/GumN family protein [Sphingobium sufflavum]MCE7797933.1 TraB/GumN family protein [Sphingobium sufflavum]
MPVLTRFLTRLATGFAAILLLTSPGFAPIGARTVTKETLAKPALWVVRDKDTTLYLFGTIHVLRREVRWFHGPVRAAFDQSSALVLETVPTDTEVAKTTARLAIDANGPPLSEKLDAATRARYFALLDRLGIPRAHLEPFHPWFAAVSLSIAPLEKLGYDPDAGVDEVLKNTATTKGKPVLALESVDEQLGFFAGLPEATQVRFLTATIAEAEKAEAEIARMVSEWSAGRPGALADDMNDSLKDMPEIAEALLYQRNRNWATWIAHRMAQPGTVFVAVGAGHLAGKGSVQELLAAKGLTVKRVE